MSRKTARRIQPTLQTLEGRDVPSGLGLSSQLVAATSGVVAQVEPADLLREPTAGRVPGPGAPSGIIAILIGL